MQIFFYSQTGTAEDFAKRLSEEMESVGFAPTVTDVEEVDTVQLNACFLNVFQDLFPDTVSNSLVVFFASTYGEGDPPDAAVSFHEWLMSEERDADTFDGVKVGTVCFLQPHMQFAVFGLGNRSYDHYNEIGKQIHKRFGDLKGKSLCELGLGDDEDNIENDFLVWKKLLRPVVCKGRCIQSFRNHEQSMVFPVRPLLLP